MRRTRSFLLLCAVVGATVVLAGDARADRAALLPVAGVNVHEGYAAAAQSLTRDALQQAGFEVVALQGAPGAVEASPPDAVAAAQQVGARIAVVVQVTRLSSTAKVKLVVYDGATGAMLYVGSLAASTPDELDKVLTRLVQGFVSGKAPADTAQIDSVTQREADPYLKLKANQVFGVRMGVVAPLNRPDSGDESGLPGLGIFWLYDVRTFLAEVAMDFHQKDNEGDFTIAIGAYYPFSRTNTTAYLGGGMRYGAADYGGEDGDSGISGYVAGGVLFGRLSSVQLRGEVGYFQNLFASSDSSSNKIHAGGVMASVGIGF